MIETFKEILRDHFHFRRQLLKLAKSDLIKQYRGAAFGWAWAVIKPAIRILVFWFAFDIGLRVGKPMNGRPYFLWLICGYIPWFYMQDDLNRGASSIRSYKYLVKSIKFPISTIPTFISLSNLGVSLVLQLIMIAIFWMFGFPPTKYYLEIPLFILMMFVFFTAWGLFSGMLSAISRDFQNFVRAVVPALFWLSGIIYDVNEMASRTLREILLFNPITICANGYRNAMIHEVWFWETPIEMRNYCIVTLIMILLAVWAYRKLKKDIPDVL